MKKQERINAKYLPKHFSIICRVPIAIPNYMCLQKWFVIWALFIAFRIFILGVQRQLHLKLVEIEARTRHMAASPV